MISKFVRLRLAALTALASLATTAQAENVLVSWQKPTVNTDSGGATDLDVYCLWEGRSPQSLTPVMFTSASASELTLYNVVAGWHYFAMTTINKEGVESIRGPTVSYYVKTGP